MTATLCFDRVGPLTTIQDGGRHGMLAHGISASGPMDRVAYDRAGLRAGAIGGAAVEFTRAGLAAQLLEGSLRLGWDGGAFSVLINGVAADWPGGANMVAGDRIEITPGSAGNYGYLRFGAKADLPTVLGSVATSTRAGIGGLDGRTLRAGDVLHFVGAGLEPAAPAGIEPEGGSLRFIWGLHAEHFAPSLREKFVTARFRVSTMLDRMGVRLLDGEGVFEGQSILSLVSDPILPGDLQILGDGTPIVLMKDHQPTGGYPRIGTVITADMDRFAQMRPGTELSFEPVSVGHAHAILRKSV